MGVIWVDGALVLFAFSLLKDKSRVVIIVDYSRDHTDVNGV